nr:hypothetical protein HmN_000754800 [Hymenolepis microstoma]
MMQRLLIGGWLRDHCSHDCAYHLRNQHHSRLFKCADDSFDQH